ncbi:ICMT-domain-containing protein [Ganoderma leucocontextum]|nr:ICMT-domain-containing protein [Ganoderma leucocontextum]
MATASGPSMGYLAKVPALALIMFAESIAFYPPNTSPPKSDDRAKFGRPDLITRIPSFVPKIVMALYYSLHLVEIAALLAHVYPSHPLSALILARLFPGPFPTAGSPAQLALSPAFLLGFLMLVAGAALRKVCYATLGRFFTYQLALFKGHKLVTWGPYAVVRHPSYSGFIIAAAGLLIVQFGPGSYLYESGALEHRWVATAAVGWALWMLSVVAVAVGRVSTEDKVLKKEFGKEWEAWAKKTPYRLVPYLY